MSEPQSHHSALWVRDTQLTEYTANGAQRKDTYELPLIRYRYSMKTYYCLLGYALVTLKNVVNVNYFPRHILQPVSKQD